MTKIKYCSLMPEFPQEAMMVMIFFSRRGGESVLLSLRPVFSTFAEIKFWLSTAEKTLNRKKIDLDGAIIFPIKLIKLLPLKKDYWTKPSQDYHGLPRLKAFINVAVEPKLYKLLVLPTSYNGELRRWELNAAVPFYITAGDELVEKFMFSSTDPVERRAAAAALYSFGRPKGLNWETKELKDSTISLEEENVVN